MNKIEQEQFNKIYLNHIMYRAREGTDWMEKSADFSGFEIKDMEFNNLNLEWADFTNCKLVDCTFNHTILANCNFSGATIDGCVFNDCVIEDARFWHSSIYGSITRRSSFNYSRFGFTVFSGIQADDCTFNESIIDHCLLDKKLHFIITNSSIIGLKVYETDFTHARLGYIEPVADHYCNSVEEIRKTIKGKNRFETIKMIIDLLKNFFTYNSAENTK